MSVSEELNLQYRTEVDVDEPLLKKALWGSIANSWRKGFYIGAGILYLVLLCLNIWMIIVTGDYAGILRALFFPLAAIVVYLMLHRSVKTSLRRWKEQVHADVVHMFSGFNEDGFVFGQDGKHSVINYADLHKVYAVAGVWVFRTKAGLLMFYNAAQLSKTDRESVLTLLKSNNPKIKIQLPKK